MIWIGNGDEISQTARATIEDRLAQGNYVEVSAFSAWELGVLVARSRLRLPMTPQDWFQKFCSEGGVMVANATVDVLVASSFLPGNPPRDPADRIVIATARARDLTIVTRDAKILAYAQDGNVKAIAC